MKFKSTSSAHDILMYCISQQKEKRSREVNERLSFAYQNFPFFSQILSLSPKYGTLMINHIFNNLKIKIYHPGQIIWNLNEIVASMFIVLEGTVIINKTKKISNHQSRRHSHILINNINNINNNNNNNIKNINNENNKMSSNKEINKNFIKDEKEIEINIGNSLGEEYLKKKIHKRSDIAIAKTLCIIGELSITNYYIIFEKTDVLEKTSINNFLLNLPLFKDVSFSFYEKFQKIYSKKTIKKGTYIIRKGSKFKNFYIIFSGTFLLSITTNKKFFKKFDLNALNLLEENKMHFTSDRNFEIKDYYNKKEKYEILKLTKGEMFGEIEYKLKMNEYFFDVKCLEEDAKVIEINVKEFDKILNKNFMENFFEEINKRIIIINNRINDIKNEKKKIQSEKNKYVNVILSRTNKKFLLDSNKKIKFKIKNKKFNLINSRNFNININNQKFLSKYNSTNDINSDNNFIKSYYYKSSSNINETNKKDNEFKFNSYEKTTINTFSSPKTTSSERNIFRKKLNSKSNLFNNKNNDNYNNNYKTIFNSKHFRIIKDKFLNVEKKLQKIKSFSSSNRINTYNNILNIKNNNNYDYMINKRKLLLETNKNFYPKTFEINKQFLLKNNTSVLTKDDIKKIYDF